MGAQGLGPPRSHGGSACFAQLEAEALSWETTLPASSPKSWARGPVTGSRQKRAARPQGGRSRLSEIWAGHGLVLGVDGAGGVELCISFHPHHPLPRYLAKLSSVGSISEEETCEKLKGLIQRQVQMCKRNLEVMDSVRRGAQLAIEECQYQFRNRRWNCSTLDSLPVFGKVVTQGEGGARGGAGGSAGCGPSAGGPWETSPFPWVGNDTLASGRTSQSLVKQKQRPAAARA